MSKAVMRFTVVLFLSWLMLSLAHDGPIFAQQAGSIGGHGAVGTQDGAPGSGGGHSAVIADSDIRTYLQDNLVPGVIMIKFAPAGSGDRRGKDANGGDAQGSGFSGVAQISQSDFERVEEELRRLGPATLRRVLETDRFEEVRSAQLQKVRSGAAASRLKDDLARTFRADISATADPIEVARRISLLPGVEYAEPRVRHMLQDVPNDSLFGLSGQDYFTFQRIPQAWEVTTSDTDIVIAIVDSGVDYNHPDLWPKLWRNPEPGRAQALFPAIFSEVENDTIGWNFWADGPISNPIQNGDPIGDFQSHGTHVAGIAAAATNNQIGVASAGYNSAFMAVRAGGTEAEPRAIGFGYEGVLYAAVNGADVINCSFGSPFESQFGRDVVDFATALGSLVVGAAGNTRNESLFYPASYENVLAVASVERPSGARSDFSTYNYGIDVSATGRSLRSTVFDNGYGFNTGTSMAAPVVSGVAALLRHARPDWSPERVMGQIRSAANPDIYSQNAAVQNKLGVGLLDAGRALGTSLPSVRLVSASFLSDAGGKLGLSESGVMRLQLTNVGSTVSDVGFSVEPLYDDANLGSDAGALGLIATGDTITIDIPLSLSANMDPRENPAFLVHLESASSGYRDFLWAEYTTLFIDTHEGNLVRASFSSNGGIGFATGGDIRTGVGFVPRVIQEGQVFDTPNILYEAGLMIAYNVDEVDYLVDNVRETDFAPLNFRPLSLFEVSRDGETELGAARFDNSFAQDAPELEVKLQTFAFPGTGLERSILVYFTVTNNDPLLRPYNDMYIGVYTDWDIANFSTNSVRFSESDSLLIAFSEDRPFPVATVGHLGGISSALAIDNAYSGEPDSLNFGVYFTPGSNSDRGFLEQYKRWSLVAGLGNTSQTNTDISMVTASGPFTLRANDSVTAGFVYAFGLDEDDLRNQVATARSLNLIPLTVNHNHPRIPTVLPTETAIVRNYPNPFNPSTRVVVDLESPSDVDIRVYDMMGRYVTTMFSGRLDNRRYELTFDGTNLASGVYLLVMQTETSTSTLRMTLLK